MPKAAPRPKPRKRLCRLGRGVFRVAMRMGGLFVEVWHGRWGPQSDSKVCDWVSWLYCTHRIYNKLQILRIGVLYLRQLQIVKSPVRTQGPRSGVSGRGQRRPCLTQNPAERGSTEAWTCLVLTVLTFLNDRSNIARSNIARNRSSTGGSSPLQPQSQRRRELTRGRRQPRQRLPGALPRSLVPGQGFIQPRSAK